MRDPKPLLDAQRATTDAITAMCAEVAEMRNLVEDLGDRVLFLEAEMTKRSAAMLYAVRLLFDATKPDAAQKQLMRDGLDLLLRRDTDDEAASS